MTLSDRIWWFIAIVATCLYIGTSEQMSCSVGSLIFLWIVSVAASVLPTAAILALFEYALVLSHKLTTIVSYTCLLTYVGIVLCEAYLFHPLPRVEVVSQVNQSLTYDASNKAKYYE